MSAVAEGTGARFKIVIIKLGALGDVVRTTAILPALKRKYPHARIEWITRRSALPLVEGNPLVDRSHAFEELDPTALGDDTDWLISLDDEREACAFAVRVSARKISGATLDGERRTYTEDVEEWFGMGILRAEDRGGIARANELKLENERSHPEIYYRMLALPGPIERPMLRLRDEERDVARRWIASNLPGHGPIVGLNTGAGARWKFKSWGLEDTAILAARLASDGYRVLVLGGADEDARNREIRALAVERDNGRVLDSSERPNPAGLAGRAPNSAIAHPGSTTVSAFPIVCAPTDWGLRAFAALIAELSLIVTSDSLALHLGNAFATPIVTFFGPTSASEITVYGTGEKVVTPLGCRGCYLKSCLVSPNCMESISVDRMEERVRAVLART